MPRALDPETGYRRGKPLVEMTEDRYVTVKLGEVRGDLDRCRNNKRYTALAQLHKVELDLREKFVRFRAAQATRTDGLTDDELIRAMTDCVLNMPPSLRQQFDEMMVSLTAENVVSIKGAAGS